ncbi:MAG: HAMP domain-containing histidine kinase [Polyangiaceae bacterium]|nr:HAMP domain-containing histidine kinase [Myxococcales bacterium]MCB9590753.1 HAMP domain-containing histidine kinase [Polyangiaceae bacterium]
MAESASSTIGVRQASKSKTRWSSVAFGVGLGLLYAVVLRWIDALWPAEHPSHLLLDWTIPTALGVGVGFVLEFARNRSEKYRAEQQALESLRERLRGSEREQAVWVLVSSLLHELRNPLHTVGLALEELRKCEEPERQERLVDRAATAVERMNSRFRELGAIADQPLHDLSAYDLGSLVRQTVEHFDALARGGGARVSCRGEPHVTLRGDEALVRTALENLVSNAVDAVSGVPNGEVDVEVVRSDDAVRIRVADNGPGIPDEMRSEIFKPLRSSKAPQKGLGLGLPIARGLARASGGDVRLEPVPAGACFLLELPLAAEGE